MNAASLARAERIERIVTLVTVLLPLAAFVIAATRSWHAGAGLAPLASCLAMYLLTVAGVTLGYHRLFTHHSFQCGAGLRRLLGIAGSMSGQGPLFFWVACHRRHHQHSDRPGDPHSPHEHGSGGWGVLRGWWHAHLGWMLAHRPENYFRLVNDLVRDRAATAVHRSYFLALASGLILPGALTAIWAGAWSAAWSGILWGGFVRMFLVHHVTWSVNSVCHLFGSAPHATEDESRNNLLVALLTLGEGWHNNHHAFPSSARHGLRAWEIDVSYGLLRVLEKCGLVWAVRLPVGKESV